ncbi:OadG family transporter subunit [Sulfurimonas sp.]|uniref:OadG family protein n=1 Tax=Sulfurimonas sp. TaxID=2022749 RepID=UPI0025D2F09A|nr:OadG family transporter subunit [Sulfurimonas sp.]MDD5156740.1 OadG family transporter subunit [Sulfurimonas sp.]
METNLVVEGAKIMLLGTGTVFLFIAIMIVAMNTMSAILTKQYPEADPIEINNQLNNQKIVAAIVAAIKHHRS